MINCWVSLIWENEYTGTDQQAIVSPVGIKYSFYATICSGENGRGIGLRLLIVDDNEELPLE